MNAKRVMDLCGALIALIVFAPLMLFTSAAIWISIGRPVCFSQVRAGQSGQPFTLYKFRTMKNTRGPDGELLPNSERKTRLGQFLRSTSIDELPSFWNVLVGDMSLVGPRPLKLGYLAVYTPEQERRHEMRPGITGWAQVNGRNAIPWEDRLRLDLWYIQHATWRLDAKILCMTLIQVLGRRGVTPPESEFMEPFRGTVTFLERLNNAVLELEQTFDAPVDAPFPVFVVGAPRSGTTLVTQLLASATNIGYVNNVMARFWKVPATGAKLSQELNLIPEFSGCSTFGLTRSAGEPHEFGGFWREMLGYKDMTQKLSDEDVDWPRLITSLRRVAAVFEQPVMYKVYQLYWHLTQFQQRWPTAKWIWVSRNPVHNALSLLKFREQVNGSRDQWISAKPAGAERYDQGTPYIQVVAQVHLIEAWLHGQLEQLNARNWLKISLEDIQGEPVRAIECLASFIGIPLVTERLPSIESKVRSGMRSWDPIDEQKIVAAFNEVY